MSKVLNLMSGGMDSAASAQFFLNQGLSVRALFVNYGQSAAKQEYSSAKRLAKFLNIEISVMKVSTNSKLGAGEITGRNALLVSCGLISRIDELIIAIGVHSGTPYYDCGSGFVDTMGRLVSEYTDGQVRLLAPFASWSKSEIFSFLESQGLPIGLTYSCEIGGREVCGDCLSCKDRAALSVSGT